jgi:hypothetical protein
VKDYALAALAGIWLTDGIALLVAPRYIITQACELLRQFPTIGRWEFLAIIAGVFLFFAAQDLPYQWLWQVAAGGMVAKGTFLSIGLPRGVSRPSIGVPAEKTSTTDSGDLVSVLLRSCYSMR